MATVTTLSGAKGLHRTGGRQVVVLENTIDFAAAATAKGSALAAADIIQAITVPAKHMIINAGLEVITANVGGSSDVALDLGVTGLDVDVFVDGFDYDAASVGDYAQNPATFQPIVIGATADTIDLLIAAATTAPTGGSVRVWAVVVPVDALTVATIVDRDQLA